MDNTKDYTKSKNTRNRFKDWLKDASYTDLLKEYNKYNLKMMIYKKLGSKGMIYPKVPSESPIENVKIVQYKLNLLKQLLIKSVKYDNKRFKFHKSL
jgi:hypothetical protein